MDTLKIIGSHPGSPGKGNPSSGYLLQTEDTNILIDCGSGIALSLANEDHLDDLDTVIVTHRHADHSVDLISLAYDRTFPAAKPTIPLYGPIDLEKLIDGLDKLFSIPTLAGFDRPIRRSFDFRPILNHGRCRVGSIEVEFYQTSHAVQTMAVKIPEFGLVYTSDAGFERGLVEFCAGADIIVAESTYVEGHRTERAKHGHMNTAEAAQLAREAAARRLVLTHLSEDQRAARAIADKLFSGDVCVAQSGMAIPLSRRTGARSDRGFVE